MGRRIALLLAPLVACSSDDRRDEGIAASDGSDGAERTRSCTTDLAPELARLGVPGLSAGVIADGHLVCTAVAGMADREADIAVTPDTVFAWASVSKTVTGTAAMILHDEGRFALDDDIDDYLPFSVRNPSCASRPITFRQLLTHSSSIVDDEAIYDASYTIGDSPVPLDTFVRDYFAAGDDTGFADACPGDVVEYSNIAIGLLGRVLEEIAGMPFDRFVAARIFVPLEMSTSSFRLADLERDLVAMPYERDAHGSFVAHGHVGFPTYPDGLVRSSVPEMARFLVMHAALGSYHGRRIISERSARAMRHPQIPDLDDTQGLVWYWEDDWLGHDGSDPGTSALAYYDPHDGSGALLVANGWWWDEHEESADAMELLARLFAEAHDE